MVQEVCTCQALLLPYVDLVSFPGLRRRALGLFKTSTTAALVQKISRDDEDADAVTRRVAEIEREQQRAAAAAGRRTHSAGDSGSRLSR